MSEDVIHRPSHYGDFTPIDAMISGIFNTEQFKGFLKGNILKYITRYDSKNGLEDLHKAQEYLTILMKLEDGTLKVGD